MDEFFTPDYKQFRSEKDTGKEWIKRLFQHTISPERSIQTKGNQTLPNLDLKVISKPYNVLNFTHANIETGFIDFVNAYLTDYANFYKQEQYKKSDKFKELSKTFLKIFLTNGASLLEAVQQDNLEKLKNIPEILELYNEYKKIENLKLNKYIPSKDILIQWRTLPTQRKTYNEIKVVYKNFKGGGNDKPLVREVLLYNDTENSKDLLPEPLKVKINHLNYLIMMDKDGNFYKFNDFIDNPEFSVVRPLVKFNLWDLEFSNFKSNTSERVKKAYYDAQREVDTIEKEITTAQKEYDELNKKTWVDIKETAPGGGTVIITREIYKQRYNQKQQERQRKYQEALQRLKQAEANLPQADDTRDKPPRLEDVKHIDFIELKSKKNVYDFVFYTKWDTSWYGRVKVDIIEQKIEFLKGSYITLTNNKHISRSDYLKYTNADGISLISYVDKDNDSDELIRVFYTAGEDSELQYYFIAEAKATDNTHTIAQYQGGAKHSGPGQYWSTTNQNDIERYEKWEKKWAGNYGLEAMDARPVADYMTGSTNKKDRAIYPYRIDAIKDFTSYEKWKPFFEYMLLAPNGDKAKLYKPLKIWFKLEILKPKFSGQDFTISNELNIKINQNDIIDRYSGGAYVEKIMDINLNPSDLYKIFLRNTNNIALASTMQYVFSADNVSNLEPVLRQKLINGDIKFNIHVSTVKMDDHNMLLIDFMGQRICELNVPFSQVENWSNKDTYFHLSLSSIDIPEWEILINKYNLIAHNPFCVLIQDDENKHADLEFKVEQAYKQSTFYETIKTLQPFEFDDYVLWPVRNKNPYRELDWRILKIPTDKDYQITQGLPATETIENTTNFVRPDDWMGVQQVIHLKQLDKQGVLVLLPPQNGKQKYYFLVKNGGINSFYRYVPIYGEMNGEISSASIAFWEENVVHIIKQDGTMENVLFDGKLISYMNTPFLYDIKSSKNYNFLGDDLTIATYESKDKLINLNIDDIKQLDNKIVAYSFINENTLNYTNNTAVDSTWYLKSNNNQNIATFKNKVVKTKNENIYFTATINFEVAYVDKNTNKRKVDKEESEKLASIFINPENINNLKYTHWSCDIYDKNTNELISAGETWEILKEHTLIKNNTLWIPVVIYIHTTDSDKITLLLKNFKIGDGTNMRKLSQWDDEIELLSNSTIIMRDIVFKLDMGE
ncbi:hypothetical protein [Mycoplasma seminis]|uniref:Uncharacterized protein n=1 Tax=Mycoplasma seminis TaxID=512749 RepID=A0ABY9H9M5_9MOLU|nr:hypothetical protein [Mycoplasma seminis]WLP85280.1 hypothetical protein Q8852_03075 [Mycoplasma seminis]